jgi:predicted nucleotidyltransferase
MTQEKGDELGLLATIGAVLGHRPELAVAYVYGSAARGIATPLSDVDVALVTCDDFPEECRGALLRDLTVELGRGCPGAPPFDVRFFDELPVSIAGRVIAEGVRVLDKDPERRVALEVSARMTYHDFLSFEREGTRAGLLGLRQAVQRG